MRNEKYIIKNYKTKLKFILVLFIFHFSFFIYVSPASAHVLKTDGSIGAVLHVSPDDDPVAGVPTEFFLEFKDKSGKFKPENCDCSVSIVQSGKEIYSQPLFESSANPSLQDASFSYNFSTKDVYQVKITGKPRSPGDFDPFTLSWDLRVARDSGNTEASTPAQTDWFSTALPYILTLAGVIIFVGLMMSRKKR